MSDVSFVLPNTPEVVELAKAKLKAEIDKLYAEKQKFDREGLAQDQIIRQLTADADVSDLHMQERRTSHEVDAARDFYHRVFRFNAPVSSKTVDGCVDTLSIWDRMYPEQPIEVVFNSPGGDASSGMELFDFIQELRRNGHYVTTSARGMAASMAGILLQAGDKRVMGREASVLIHEAATLAMGKTGELEDEVEFMKQLQRRILNIFAAGSARAFANGTGSIALTAEQFAEGDKAIPGVKGWNRRDWWLDSDQCLRFGIVDEIR